MMVCWLFFNFAASLDFGCCSLAQEMSFVDCYLPYFRQCLIICLLSALLPFQSLFTGSSGGYYFLSFPPSPVCLQHPTPSAVCFQFLIYYSVFFFAGWWVSLSRGLCWFILGVAVGIPHDACCSPVGLLDVSQAGLELASGCTGALLLSQCNVSWRSFVWARGSGCLSFDYSWCFFPAKCGSSISTGFSIYRANTIFFCTLVAILDPPTPQFWSINLYRWDTGIDPTFNNYRWSLST
jgi:hypothetical protein